MDRVARWATVQRVSKRQLNNYAYTQQRHLRNREDLEKGMATHSCILGLENSMDRGAWRAIVHRVAKSQTRLSK